MEPAATTTTGIYCKQCGYDLRASTEYKRCPECGRPFDPSNPATYRRRPLRWWLAPVRRAALALLVLLALLAAAWGCFYLGWYNEQQTLAAMRVPTNRAFYDTAYPELRYRLGRAGFVFNRVVGMDLEGSGATAADLKLLVRFPGLRRLSLARTTITDLTSLADVPGLDTLDVRGTPVTDLRPLARVRALQVLILNDTHVSDLSPLSGLSVLQTLCCSNTLVRDLAPLAGMRSLHRLDLDRTPIDDLSPLRGLAELDDLNIAATGVRDLTPLDSLKLRRLFMLQTRVEDITILSRLPSLESLFLPWGPFPQSQLDAFRRARPACQVVQN